MQYRPTAGELLATIADLLDQELLPALPPDLQHKARVAANLARILEREQRLGPEGESRERALLSGLLGHDGDALGAQHRAGGHAARRCRPRLRTGGVGGAGRRRP